MAAVVAAGVGWKAIYLGPSLPAEEVAFAACECGARAVAMSLTYPPDDGRVQGELLRLREHLAPDVPLIIGGRAASAYQPLAGRDGISWAQSFAAFEDTLNRCRNLHGAAER